MVTDKCEFDSEESISIHLLQGIQDHIQMLVFRILVLTQTRIITRPSSFIFGFMICWTPMDSAAMEVQWTNGSHSTLWSNPENWTPSVPTASDDVIIPPNSLILVDDNVQPSFRSLILKGSVTFQGEKLPIARTFTYDGSGVCRFPDGTSLQGDCVFVVNLGYTVRIDGTLDLQSHKLSVAGDGTCDIQAQVAGMGECEFLGPGIVQMRGRNTFTGQTHILGGSVEIIGDAVENQPGPIGQSAQPVLINKGTLVLGGELFSRPLEIGTDGGHLDARDRPRCISGRITTFQGSGAGIEASFLPVSLRAVNEDDLRIRTEVSGRRTDRMVFFPNSAFGTPAERLSFGIAGTDVDWDNFTVQWDGWLFVPSEGTVLSTCSDDGSRVWLDLNGDGKIQPNEWGSNGWGNGQGATVRPVHGPLHAGFYRMRIQYEDGGGPDCMSLLWTDSHHEAGAYQGLFVVPPSCIGRSPSLIIGSDPNSDGSRGQPIIMSGIVTGSGNVTKRGLSTLTVESPCTYEGDTWVEGGIYHLSHQNALPEHSHLHIAESASVMVDTNMRVACVDGLGILNLAHGSLTWHSDEPSSFNGHIRGLQSLVLEGKGPFTIDGSIEGPVNVPSGIASLPNGRLISNVTLHSPLTTIAELPSSAIGPKRIDLSIRVPEHAPDDLGCGLCLRDQHGTWFQCFSEKPLISGSQNLTFTISQDTMLQNEPGCCRWDAAAFQAGRLGIFFWSASRHPLDINVGASVTAISTPEATNFALIDMHLPTLPLNAGERGEWSCRPSHFPDNPYDPTEFYLDAVFTPDQGRELRIPAFFRQRMISRDRGDREEVSCIADDGFVTRFRPTHTGHWHMRWEASWKGGKTLTSQLPDFEVVGKSNDPFVRIDGSDPRFFKVGSHFFWPIGLNIRSVNDVRSRDCLHTMITPDRGTFSYEAYISRLAASGGTAMEVWLAPWNLGMEWRSDWNGFYGQGRYNQQNAWRLDRVLDCAWEHGVRVNLVVTNHGQASDSCDPEWQNSPYSRKNGGKVVVASDYFTSPWAIRGQDAYRRYLIARYADHPAVLGWKLFSEVNLTAAGEHVVLWHEQACQRWHHIDAYGHPVTTHWAGDYNAADRRVVALKNLDYVCIDAYHSGQLLANLLGDGVDTKKGLGSYGKPILVTECGGNWNACTPNEMIAEQSSGPWAAFVTGNAGSPMLWWFEFVDQHDLWAPYHAISSFIKGEDLRGTAAHTETIVARSSRGDLWCRAWVRPGRILGYALDPNWGAHGSLASEYSDARLELDDPLSGSYVLEWWNADTGEVIIRTVRDFSGDRISLQVPTFQHHVAFKLWKDSESSATR